MPAKSGKNKNGGHPKMATSAFPVALRELFDAYGISQREVSRRTRATGQKGLSHVTIGFLAQGRMEPSKQAMEWVALAFGIAPDYFAEYRLVLAREALDQKIVGLSRALDNLTRLPKDFPGAK